DDDVQHRTARYAHQLVLRVRLDLVVEPPDGPGPGGKGMVVLDKIGRDPDLGQPGLVEGFAEEATAVPDPSRRDQEHVRNGERGHVQRGCSSCSAVAAGWSAGCGSNSNGVP